MKKIGILLISTNKYSKFIQPLIDSIERYFLTNHKVSVHLFTDTLTGTGKIPVYRYIIPSYKFPQATLYRYKIFSKYRDWLTEDYLFYIDIDSLIISPVTDEILNPYGLTAVHHPGFYTSKGWGSPSVDERSLAYLPQEKRKYYPCGGMQGGTSVSYKVAIMTLADRIEEDERNNVMAQWHDESHWARYVNEYDGPITALDPSFMMVENVKQRKLWGIDHLEPKIIALDKQHKELRS